MNDDITTKYVKLKDKIIKEFYAEREVFNEEFCLLKFHEKMSQMESKLGKELRSKNGK